MPLAFGGTAQHVAPICVTLTIHRTEVIPSWSRPNAKVQSCRGKDNEQVLSITGWLWL